MSPGRADDRNKHQVPTEHQATTRSTATIATAAPTSLLHADHADGDIGTESSPVPNAWSIHNAPARPALQIAKLAFSTGRTHRRHPDVAGQHDRAIAGCRCRRRSASAPNGALALRGAAHRPLLRARHSPRPRLRRRSNRTRQLPATPEAGPGPHEPLVGQPLPERRSR